MAQINLGRIQPIDRGVYSPTFAYKKLDFVTAQSGSSYYTCIQDAPVGTPLTNAQYFRQVIASVGDAVGVFYDNSTSGLSASNVQDLGDELKEITDAITGKEVATGTATFTALTNNINLAGVGVGVELGDVITISGTVSNDGDYTIEVITDNDNVIVNQAHANSAGSLALTDETVSATVTLLSKWFFASDGLGQDWVDVSSVRTQSVEYFAPPNRTMQVAVTGPATTSTASITSKGLQLYRNDSVDADQNTMNPTIDRAAGYTAFNVGAVPALWLERR